MWIRYCNLVVDKVSLLLTVTGIERSNLPNTDPISLSFNHDRFISKHYYTVIINYRVSISLIVRIYYIYSDYYIYIVIINFIPSLLSPWLKCPVRSAWRRRSAWSIAARLGAPATFKHSIINRLTSSFAIAAIVTCISKKIYNDCNTYHSLVNLFVPLKRSKLYNSVASVWIWTNQTFLLLSDYQALFCRQLILFSPRLASDNLWRLYICICITINFEIEFKILFELLK